MAYNKFTPLNEALADKQFKNGLSRYQQSHCKITLTDQGYRIYRDPNLTQSANGNVMWGGFLVKPFQIDENFLIKNHKYIILVHIKGQSSNSIASVYWSNQAGNGGASHGLSSQYTTHKLYKFSSQFKGQFNFVWEFTITGDIWKTCTSSYSSFVEGTSYNCYRDLIIGFGYTNTGTLGTDIYLTDLRCYDITNINEEVRCKRNNIFEISELSQHQNSKIQIYKPGNLQSNYIYEI